MRLHKNQVAYALTRNGIVLQSPAVDAYYNTVDRAWFLGTFGGSLMQTLRVFGESANTGVDAWDCDDLALFGVAYARLLNARSKNNGDSIAIGFVGYGGLMGVEAHAVIVGVTAPEEIACFDPTTQTERTLTQTEKELCRATYF
jgi:hypothetical protein